MFVKKTFKTIMKKIKTKKGLLITIFLSAIFILAVAVWYSPIIFKGYSTQGISQDMLLARNYHQTGVLATHNNQSILISSSLIKEEGHPLIMSQYLRSFFYAKIFNIIGVPDYNNLVLTSIVLYALVLVLFTILVLYLFNFKVAIVFSLIYIFSPLGWGLASCLGLYEFCLIFWALFFIFYFLGAQKIRQPQSKFSNLFFIISGIFLCLSALSREATLVFALAFFTFLVIKKLKQQLIYIFIPFVILLTIFWLPSFLSGENRYISLFTGDRTEKLVSIAPLHVFPDPYTYYFEKEEFLEKFRNQDLGWTEDLQIKKDLTNFGFEKISLFERVKVGFFILSQHLSRFFSLEDFGGPFILLLWILGIVYLKKKNVFLYKLFIYWIGISLFIFSFVILVGRNHMMDFLWPIILGIALGLLHIFRIVKDHFQIKNKKALILDIIIIGLVVYHLVLVNHVVFGRLYDKDIAPRSITYAREIKKLNIGDIEVIAIPGDFPGQGSTLNYLTNKSFVIFRSSTLNKLLEEDKTKQALEAFGVKYILGYSDELSDKIADQAAVVNIAANSLEIDMGQVSANKSFFMNIIR